MCLCALGSTPIGQSVGYPNGLSRPAVAAQGHPTYRDLTRLKLYYCVSYRNLRDLLASLGMPWHTRMRMRMRGRWPGGRGAAGRPRILLYHDNTTPVKKAWPKFWPPCSQSPPAAISTVYWSRCGSYAARSLRQEPSPTHQEPSPTHQEPSPTHQEPSPSHQEPSPRCSCYCRRHGVVSASAAGGRALSMSPARVASLS